MRGEERIGRQGHINGRALPPLTLTLSPRLCGSRGERGQESALRSRAPPDTPYSLDVMRAETLASFLASRDFPSLAFLKINSRSEPLGTKGWRGGTFLRPA